MQSSKIPILMYHSIELMPKSTVMRSLHVPPARFNIQMWMLKKLGYKGLSIRELKPYLSGKKTGKVVGITFDDGYQNNLINAVPILNKFQFSATCYIVSSQIGNSNIWDSSKGITQRPLMTKKEIQTWLDLGMDIGAHSLTHPDLVTLSIDDLKIEIQDCKNELEKTFNISIEDFCYPYGSFNDTTISLVKDTGYHTATTMLRGIASLKTDKLKLPRVPINHHTLPHLFLAKILSKYEERRE